MLPDRGARLEAHTWPSEIGSSQKALETIGAKGVFFYAGEHGLKE
jgi:hypothetical protein